MWRLIVYSTAVLIFVHALYFSGRVRRALVTVRPGAERAARIGRAVYLVVATSAPVLGILYGVAGAVTGTSGRIPDTWWYAYLIGVPFWLVTVYAVQCTLLILPLELTHWLARRLRLLTGHAWVVRRSVAVLVIAAGFALYVPVRIALGTNDLVVRSHVHVSPEVPAELDGYRIALIGDLQAERFTGPDRLARYVRATNAARPDLIVVAGDFIDRGPAYIDLAATYAGELAAPDGVVACVGDHDNFAYGRDRERSVREVQAALAARGVALLDNEVRRVEVGGRSLAVVLATNNYINSMDPAGMRRLVQRAAGADVVAVCAHQTSPDLLAAARDAGAHLFLGGHTHGGQVRFWLPFYDLAPVRLETPHVSGSYRVGDLRLVVTNGLGYSVAPFRYRTPATIDLIELKRPQRRD